MPRRKTLSDTMIAALKPNHKPNLMPDPQLAGHYIRINKTGKTFVAVARSPSGTQIWHTIGSTQIYTVKQARERARDAIIAIKEGKQRKGVEPFEKAVEDWYERSIVARGLITRRNIRSNIDQRRVHAARRTNSGARCL